jgi:hypothetical protein
MFYIKIKDITFSCKLLQKEKSKGKGENHNRNVQEWLPFTNTYAASFGN